MEIQDPADLNLAANLEQLLLDVDDELSRFRELGDFSPEVLAELQRAFLPERISATLNIEGIRVNPRVTRAIRRGLDSRGIRSLHGARGTQFHRGERAGRS